MTLTQRIYHWQKYYNGTLEEKFVSQIEKLAFSFQFPLGVFFNLKITNLPIPFYTSTLN